MNRRVLITSFLVASISLPEFLTGGASDARADVRVENRVLEKRGRLFPRAGFSYLADRSFYASPGIATGASFFVSETVALDAEATALFASLNSAGETVRTQTGFLPDAARPQLLLAFGARYAFGYGKMQIEANGGIARFVPTIGAHVVVKKTDVDWNAGFRLDLALTFHLHARFSVAVGWAFVGTFEDRSSGSFQAGQLPSITLGTML